MVKWMVIEKVVSNLLERVSHEDELSESELEAVRREIQKEVERDLEEFKRNSIEKDLKLKELEGVQNRRLMVERSTLYTALGAVAFYLTGFLSSFELWAGVLGAGAVGAFLAHTLYRSEEERKREIRGLAK